MPDNHLGRTSAARAKIDHRVEVPWRNIDVAAASVPSREVLAERLREVRLLMGKTQSELANSVGVHLRTWQDYEAGKSVPTGEVYGQICAAGVNIEWLLGGEAPALHSSLIPRAEPTEGYVALPRYDVRAAAGAGAPVITEQVADYIYFETDWLRRTMGLTPSQLALIEAIGDSMNPTIHDGDLLLLDVTDPKLRGDGLYVIGEGDALLVKRISVRLGGRGLSIRSDNEQYSWGDRDLDPDELSMIRLVGRVVWVGGRV